MGEFSRTRAGALARVARRQVRNLKHLLSGRPVTAPPFVGATLDPDDVALARAWLAQPARWAAREETRAYEVEFARWNGSAHAFAFAAGREALGAGLAALGLRPGDEVVLPGYTCVVVANALYRAGLVPVFCDIELAAYGPDVASVERCLGPRTRALLVQHLYGVIARDYEALVELAARRGLPVIEDCAHATGARWRGVRVGNRGALAIYSSEFSKAFSTVQGGVATTNDEAVAARLRAHADSAPLPDPTAIERQLHTVALDYYQFKDPRRWWLGDVMDVRFGKWRWEGPALAEEPAPRPDFRARRLPAPLAALGGLQLAKLDSYNERRRAAARRWDAWCRAKGYAPPLVLPASEPIFLRYPVLVEPARKADRFWAYEELGVNLGDWFRSHLHPVARPVPGCPNAEVAVARCVNFPTLGVAGTEGG